jgi:hypothetical protein
LGNLPRRFVKFLDQKHHLMRARRTAAGTGHEDNHFMAGWIRWFDQGVSDAYYRLEGAPATSEAIA